MKKVIITGVSTGLGYEIAKILIARGVEVIGLSRNKPDINIHHIAVDMTDRKQLGNIIKNIKDNFPNFDSIILCAGGGYIEEFESLDGNHIDNTISLNLSSNIKFINELLPIIKKNGIDILTIGATIGYKANQYMPVYSIAKWGLRGFIENIRDVLKQSKSRVIFMSPGGMNTESNIGLKGRETIIAKKTGKQIGSLIDVQEVAKLVDTFLSLPKNIEISEVMINRK